MLLPKLLVIAAKHSKQPRHGCFVAAGENDSLLLRNCCKELTREYSGSESPFR